MHDRIRSVLDTKGRIVFTTAPATSVFAAVTMMNERRIGALVIVEERATIGILTERDVLVRLVAAGLDPKMTVVGEVMTRDPITVGPATTVADAMRLMTEYRCRHLPVIDDGELHGLISIGDLTNWVVCDQQRRIDDLHDFIRAA
jgi:CBS domain-containing protein